MSEQKVNSMLAVCTGCRIGEAVDVDLLIQGAKAADTDLQCMKSRALCSEAGLAELSRQLSSGQIGSLAIAACSQRAKTEQFNFEGIRMERVNLREQLAWVMEAGHVDTRDCALDQVNMALARLAAIKDNKPYIPEEPSKDILVLGGGISGLNAALHGALAGYRVHLIEKSASLGGYAAGLGQLVPEIMHMPLQENLKILPLVDKVSKHPNIDIHLNSTIASLEGEPGAFHVRLQNKVQGSMKVGSLVLSTGWRPYDPAKLSNLGYGSDKVKTLEEFEHSSEKIPDRVCFLLCAGSRDKEHLPYCSSYCCTAALKQALIVREKNPDSTVFIIYRDIRTTGFQEGFYKQVQADDAILMTKGRVNSVREQGNKLRVGVEETLLGEDISIESDMVVLATGMVPNKTEELHLAYRQGEGIPSIEYDFSDSHFICFPYETRRTGIYAAGTVRAPMDMEASAEDGAGAMMKAVQCVECVQRGEALHPRSGDTSWPELYMERCTDCKRCTEECPFGAYDETEKGTPLPNPARCRRCGICVGSCPERVIGFSDYSINSVSAMIKSVSMPDEFEEKPRILVFVCENDAYPALDEAGIHNLNHSPFVRIIPVRCLGSINKVWISDALSHGYDGILQIGCKPGDDYQCHFIHGSELTEQRGENLQETLQTMMLEPERIQTSFVEITDHHEITRIINDYVEELDLLGPNPFKSM